MTSEKKELGTVASDPRDSLPEPHEKPASRPSSTTSSDDDEVVPVTVEAYDDFAEPIQVLSEEHHGGKLSKQVTGVSMARTITSDPEFEVDFGENDPENPKNWSLWKISINIFVIAYMTLCLVLTSTSYTSAIRSWTKPGIMELFGVDETYAVLGVTLYLIGLAIGSIVLAPLSEVYGRRPVYFFSIGIFVILVLPSALAKNFTTVLVTRFFGSLFGAAMLANAPGSINDMVKGQLTHLQLSVPIANILQRSIVPWHSAVLPSDP
jgi:hypothetical protein